jgi:aminopeptidase N
VVALTVKQTQRVEGRVGLFHIPTEVEITTASGPKLFPITVSQDKDTAIFTFPAESAPLMVLFDKGGHILKSAEFHKEKREWLYQLKNAPDLADRAEAITGLAKLKGDDEVVAALNNALLNDKAWGIRANAADALGQVGGSAASKQLLEALNTAKEPWVRNRIVSSLANFKDLPAVVAKLSSIAGDDSSYRARAAALQALGRLKAPDALASLDAAVTADSPDGFLRNAALRSMGPLGDDKAVPVLLQWSAPGKPIDSRNAAISSLARLQKDNKDVTNQIASYLSEPHFSVRMASIFALGARGDASAIPALEALLKSDDLSIEMVPMIKRQIASLKAPAGEKRRPRGEASGEEEDSEASASPATNEPGAVAKRLDHLEDLMQEMADRLKTIETRLPPPKQ